MPTTVNDLIEHFNLPKSKCVKWNEKISSQEEGVYIVSTSQDPNLNNGIHNTIPVSKQIIQKWISKMNGFELDKEVTFDTSKIIQRLSEFWLSDENILYIGKAPIRKSNKGIGNRVNEYYRTDYGERSPHAGGHWIKSLTILDNVFVHYILCDNSSNVENQLLNYFIQNVSNTSKEQLRDKELTLPFANLELTKGRIKKHGLGNMKKKK